MVPDVNLQNVCRCLKEVNRRSWCQQKSFTCCRCSFINNVVFLVRTLKENKRRSGDATASLARVFPGWKQKPHQSCVQSLQAPDLCVHLSVGGAKRSLCTCCVQTAAGRHIDFRPTLNRVCSGSETFTKEEELKSVYSEGGSEGPPCFS